jgi:uncharacterized protein with GYD domain
VGEYDVVTLKEKPNDATGSNIERLAQTRGLKVKASLRGNEIWIERLA